MSRVCIVVPHADDETLGFGGTIQYHLTRGDSVSVLICREPHDERTKQQIKDSKTALKILGVKEICYLNVTEVEISNTPLKLFRKLEEQLLNINPDIVYTTFWGDNHQDHKILFDCVARATRVHGPLKVKKLLVGEIPSSTDQSPKLYNNIFIPNTYISITREHLHNKIIAMEAYTTESRLPPHPRSADYLSCVAKMRGIECGAEYAEAFIVVRQTL